MTEDNNPDPQEVYIITGEALYNLAVKGENALKAGDNDRAISIFTLMNTISYSLAESLRVSVVNSLKTDILPAELLEVRYTGAESPLKPSEGDIGQYL